MKVVKVKTKKTRQAKLAMIFGAAVLVYITYPLGFVATIVSLSVVFNMAGIAYEEGVEDFIRDFFVAKKEITILVKGG